MPSGDFYGLLATPSQTVCIALYATIALLVGMYCFTLYSAHRATQRHTAYLEAHLEQLVRNNTPGESK
jgi:hypothetical protein